MVDDVTRPVWGEREVVGWHGGGSEGWEIAG